MNSRQLEKLAFARKLASLLDDKFSIGGIKFGLDPVLDVIPGFGDIITNLIGMYIVFVASDLGLPRVRIYQMILNIAIDFLVGLVPVLGDVATVFYRSNRKNIKIIENYLSEVNEDKIEEAEVVA